MNAFEELFTHFPNFRIIVCRDCKFAVVPDQIKAHLNQNHQTLTASTRKNIVEQVGRLDHVAYRTEDVIYPVAVQDAVRELGPVIEQCFECKECGLLRESRKGIEAHCRKEHNWSSTKSRGGRGSFRSQAARNQPFTEGHYCQRFFKYAQWTKLFKVLQAVPHVQSSHHDFEADTRAQKLADGATDELKSKLQELHRQREVGVSDVRSAMDPWLDHTGWASHLSGFEKEKLRASLNAAPQREADEEGRQVVNEEENAIETACRATGSAIKKAMDISNPYTIPRAALHYVNRKETGAENNETPFYNKHKASTLKKYARVWVSLLRYLWRSQTWEKKPAYQLTTGQKAKLETVQRLARQPISNLRSSEKSDARGKLEWAVVLFWASMLDQELLDNEFESGFLSAVAVLGLDTDDAGWVKVFNFTPKLAAIVTITRALVIWMAYKQRQDHIHQLTEEEGMGEVEAKKRAVSVVEGVHTMVPRLICLQEYGGVASPMDRILHMKTYGMRIRFTEKAAARVTWMNRCQEVCIDRVSFSMGDLRDAMHGLQERCQDRLVKQVMFLQREEELPILRLERLFDNPSDLTEGWSFLDDERNEETLGQIRRADGKDVDSRKWLWSRLMREDHLVKRFLLNDDMAKVEDWTGLQWNLTQVENYFRSVTLFKEELIVLCHMASGAPARGTEITSVRAANGESGGGQRGVFIDNGMVELVTGYHKGYSKSGEAKIIHRYLPDEAGKLVVYYLWLVEPFVQTIRWAARRDCEFSRYLWEPEPEKKWDGEVDGVGEGEESASEASDGGGREDDDDDGDDTQEGEGEEVDREDNSGGSDKELEAGRREGRDRMRRRVSTGRQEAAPKAYNTDGFWNTERLKRVMKRELTKAQAGFVVTPSSWRQLYPAIQRVHCPEEGVTKQLDKIYSGIRAKDQQMQSGHGKRMEDLIYGILTTENPFSTQSEQSAFREVSTSWHRFIRWPSAVAGQTNDAVAFEEQSRRAEEERWAKLRKVDLNVAIREMLGPNATFRGLQLEGLEAIISGEPRVVMVMRTGGGKSLMFMLPAFCSSGGTTIVVVPLISLRSDLERRCREVGLKAGRWPEQAARHARIVLVTPESAVTKAFNRFINDKLATGQLDRIVIDESHVVLDSSETWRPKVLELCEFATRGCQIVYLTATLPPKEEASWLEAMGLETKMVRMIRDTTSRRNIAYQVVEYDKQEEEERVAELVRQKLDEHKEGQIIIYCRRVDQCERVGEVLKCPVYHRNVGDEEEKRKILEQLVRGSQRVFAATTAMGMGVDAPHIRVVVHVGVKELVRDYAQESGRVGRDGEASEAILMRGYHMMGDRRMLEKGFKMERGMHEYLEGGKCRRVTLDREMDGRIDRIGCESGEKRCDVCNGTASGRRKTRVVVRAGGFVPSQRLEGVDEETRSRLGDNGAGVGTEDGADTRDTNGSSESVSESESESDSTAGSRFGFVEVGGNGERMAAEGKPSKRSGEETDHERDAKRARQAETEMREQREEISRRKKAMLVVRGTEEVGRDQLLQKLEEWRGVGCSICWAQGQIQRARRARSWKQCAEHSREAEERMEETLRKVESLKIARFSGCQFCWAPQSICQRWEEKAAANGSKTAAFRRSGIAGAGCQYRGVIVEIGGAVMSQRMGSGIAGEGWEWEWVEREMEKAVGFWEGGDVEEEEWGRLWRWVVRKKVTNMMETNELVRMLYHVS